MRQLCLRVDIRCLELTAVDVLNEDRDAGVGCGVLTDEARTI